MCLEKIIEKIKPQYFHWIFPGILVVGMVIGGILVNGEIRLSSDGYYYTLSSIVQGLFAILALAGIFVVFQARRFDEFIDKFDKDIRRDFKKIKGHFEEQEFEKILNYYLEHRLMEKYFKLLETIKDNVKTQTEKLAYRSCCHKGFLIFLYRTKRDCMLKCLKYPMTHGIIIIILAVFFLPLLTTEKSYTVPLISSNIPLIPMEAILGALVFGSIIVILETFYVIHLSLWRDFPRDWQKKVALEKQHLKY